MYKVQEKLLISCKTATERLIDLLVDKLRSDPSDRKKILKELSEAQDTLQKLNQIIPSNE